MSMFQNGIDYIERAVNSYHEGDTKITCMFLWSGILLLLKQRLYDIHPSLILDKIEPKLNKNNELVIPELDKKGNFKTLSFDGVISRYKKNNIDTKLLDDYKRELEQLRKLRNRIEHFAFDVKDDDILKIFQSLMPFLNKFIEQELDAKPHDVFQDYDNFLQIEQFYESRIESMQDYIEKEEPGYSELKHGDLPLEKLECGYCSDGIMISHGDKFYCETCSHEESLFECIRCGSRIPESECSRNCQEISICDDCWETIIDRE